MHLVIMQMLQILIKILKNSNYFLENQTILINKNKIYFRGYKLSCCYHNNRYCVNSGGISNKLILKDSGRIDR